MADYKVTDAQLSGIANAIRSKGGTSEPLAFPSAFVSAIQAIPSGITPSGSISISQNGTYDVSAFADAVVDVEGADPNVLNNYNIAKRASTGTIVESSLIINDYAFESNANVTGLILENATSIGASAFHSCINLAFAELSACINIGGYAFFGCTNLSSLSLPNCVTIGIQAFRMARNLASLDLPNVETIGDWAFNTTAVSVASFPKATYFGGSAFAGCPIVSLYLLGSSIPNLTWNAFSNTPLWNGGSGKIYVPASMVEAYKTTGQWSARHSQNIYAYEE